MFQRQAFALLSILVTTGCVVATSEPLSDPAGAEPDQSLYGHWILTTQREDGDREEVHAFIGKHNHSENPKSIMEAVKIQWNPGAQSVVPEEGKDYFTVTRIKNTSYLNLFGIEGAPGLKAPLFKTRSFETWTNNPKHFCTIVRYSCDGTKLRIWPPDKVVLEQLLKQERLKSIKPARDMASITTDSLVDYLRETGGEELFKGGPLEFSRAP